MEEDGNAGGNIQNLHCNAGVQGVPVVVGHGNPFIPAFCHRHLTVGHSVVGEEVNVRGIRVAIVGIVGNPVEHHEVEPFIDSVPCRYHDVVVRAGDVCVLLFPVLVIVIMIYRP